MFWAPHCALLVRCYEGLCPFEAVAGVSIKGNRVWSRPFGTQGVFVFRAPHCASLVWCYEGLCLFEAVAGDSIKGN